ncbi:MAG TPA: ABC transporter permease [Thermoleophilaceae bacterium]|nr:ABC transporter permease [Thermoleophilaceae bacterium]
MTTVALPNPRMAFRVWRRDLRVFSNLWKGALLPTFLDPVLYLLAMGFGLGAYIASINGIPYKDFIASGLVASAAMWATAFETTYNVHFRMTEYRLYDNVLSTPVEVEDLVLGEMAWACTRAVIYGTVFLIIVAVFGLIHSPWAVVTPVFIVIGAACFAVIGLSFTTIVGKVDYFTYYYTLFVTPMFLFSGIFYPLDRLPGWTHVVAWFTPLYHLVLITRGLILGPHLLSVLGNTLWLVVVTAILFSVPVIWMRKRLVP